MNKIKMAGYKLAGLGAVITGAFAVATSAGATGTLAPTDVTTMVTDGITSLSTGGGAVLGALIVIIVALVLFGFAVKKTKKHVK